MTRPGRPIAPTVAAPTRPAMIRSVCKLYGATALADEFNAQGLSVREAHDLLDRACAGARTISPAGVASVRIGLVALARRGAARSAEAETDRVKSVAALLQRFDLVHTRAGVAIATSDLDPDVLAGLVDARADAFGRLDTAAQAGLVRDLLLMPKPTKETTA